MNSVRNGSYFRIFDIMEVFDLYWSSGQWYLFLLSITWKNTSPQIKSKYYQMSTQHEKIICRRGFSSFGWHLKKTIDLLHDIFICHHFTYFYFFFAFYHMNLFMNVSIAIFFLPISFHTNTNRGRMASSSKFYFFLHLISYWSRKWIYLLHTYVEIVNLNHCNMK